MIFLLFSAYVLLPLYIVHCGAFVSYIPYFMVVRFVLNCYEENKKKEKREANWVSIYLCSSHIVTFWKDKFFLAMFFLLIFTVLYY